MRCPGYPVQGSGNLASGAAAIRAARARSRTAADIADLCRAGHGHRGHPRQASQSPVMPPGFRRPGHSPGPGRADNSRWSDRADRAGPPVARGLGCWPGPGDPRRHAGRPTLGRGPAGREGMTRFPGTLQCPRTRLTSHPGQRLPRATRAAKPALGFANGLALAAAERAGLRRWPSSDGPGSPGGATEARASDAHCSRGPIVPAVLARGPYQPPSELGQLTCGVMWPRER